MTTSLMVTGGAAAISAFLFAQSISTDRATKLPRIKSAMNQVEVSLRSMVLQPSSFTCAQVGATEKANCTINLANLSSLERELPGADGGSRCKISLQDAGIGTAGNATVNGAPFVATLKYTCSSDKDAERVASQKISIDIPGEITTVTSSTFTCADIDINKPILVGFNSTGGAGSSGGIKCVSMKSSCAANEYVTSIDQATMKLTCSPIPSAALAESTGKMLGGIIWKGPNITAGPPVARKNPSSLAALGPMFVTSPSSSTATVLAKPSAVATGGACTCDSGLTSCWDGTSICASAGESCPALPPSPTPIVSPSPGVSPTAKCGETILDVSWSDINGATCSAPWPGNAGITVVKNVKAGTTGDASVKCDSTTSNLPQVMTSTCNPATSPTPPVLGDCEFRYYTKTGLITTTPTTILLNPGESTKFGPGIELILLDPLNPPLQWVAPNNVRCGGVSVSPTPNKCVGLTGGTDNLDGTYTWSDRFGCFVAGSKVTMADGSVKNIEEVEVGEQVRTFDELKSEFTESQVQEVLHHEEKENELYTLQLSNSKFITANHVHPFFVPSKNRYYSSAEIFDQWASGQRVDLLSESGSIVYVLNISYRIEKVTLYNLHVLGRYDGNANRSLRSAGHDYFVEGTLVHNYKVDDPTFCTKSGSALINCCTSNGGTNPECLPNTPSMTSNYLAEVACTAPCDKVATIRSCMSGIKKTTTSSDCTINFAKVFSEANPSCWSYTGGGTLADGASKNFNMGGVGCPPFPACKATISCSGGNISQSDNCGNPAASVPDYTSTYVVADGCIPAPTVWEEGNVCISQGVYTSFGNSFRTIKFDKTTGKVISNVTVTKGLAVDCGITSTVDVVFFKGGPCQIQ